MSQPQFESGSVRYYTWSSSHNPLPPPRPKQAHTTVHRRARAHIHTCTDASTLSLSLSLSRVCVFCVPLCVCVFVCLFVRVFVCLFGQVVTSAEARFNKIHIRKVYACLAVTCHLHFWQNDRDFLRATVVTRGWNGYRNKSQHRKSTLEKKILPPFQQGFEPATFQSRVRCSNH